MWPLKTVGVAGIPLLLAAGALMAPNEADACGGTFCDAFIPGGMPVNQTGEVILFVSDGDFVEAHVQIQYDGGDADQFAWLVPVPEVPEIEVGSWRLVQAALNGTAPVYQTEYEYFCEDDPMTTGVGFIRDPDGGGTSTEPDVGPDVVAQDVVGAFEFAILQGGDSASINDWLSANGYATDDEAPEILDTYIAEGSVFVAFRLRHGAEVEDIHPVVIRYQGTEPCIPLRLTRIAAEEDMEITALFLGDSRTVPTNYRHVELNPLRINWLESGNDYADAVAMAVDTPGADGRAFVTEYAGTTDVIDGAGLDTSTYDSSAFADVAIVDVVNTLQAQGLVTCDTDGCAYRHELVSSLLHEFIPVPDGLEDGQFYSCLSCYAQLIDVSAWDGAEFIAAYDERIVAPLDHGSEILSMWPYATRLYTRISPHEMTTDPMFAQTEGLGDQPSRHGGRRSAGCCDTVMQFPDGREMTLLNGYQWPPWSQDMPWAQRVDEFAPGGGAPINLVDETANIDAQLAEWNAVHGCGDETGGDETAGDGPGDGPADGPGDGPMTSATSGATAGDTSGSTADQDDDGSGGCGCTSRPRTSLPWLMLVFGLTAGLRRRRLA